MPDGAKRDVFVTGGTGFMGRRLIKELLRRGHRVRALVRAGSETKVPAGCAVLTGDPLEKSSFAANVAPSDTFVQLVGVAHPNPAKREQFRAVDYRAGRAGVEAAAAAGVRHFVYVSVAQPAPVMKAYIEVRAAVEEVLRQSGLNATILRPWYVMGPGRRWPMLLRPFYWLMQRIPTTRESARRLGLVTQDQMLAALVIAVENPATGVKIVPVVDICRSVLTPARS
ncbi:MAG TPA: NAD(P)H-binding protein [Methylomirabilota bacterium]|jgi:uncharacterized protein YbjT (DUF2867 family)|nr:NAD(P)H-binding protein [Methylomirabilota bacterium]